MAVTFENISTREESETNNAYHGYNFSSRTRWLEVFGSQAQFTYLYQHRTDSLTTIDDNISIYRADFRESFTPDLSWSLRVKYAYSHSLSFFYVEETEENRYLYPSDDLTQSSIEVSLSYKF